MIRTNLFSARLPAVFKPVYLIKHTGRLSKDTCINKVICGVHIVHKCIHTEAHMCKKIKTLLNVYSATAKSENAVVQKEKKKTAT